MVLVVTLLMVTLCLTPTVIEADESATLESGPDVAIDAGADVDLGKFAEGSRTDDETIAKVNFKFKFVLSIVGDVLMLVRCNLIHVYNSAVHMAGYQFGRMLELAVFNYCLSNHVTLPMALPPQSSLWCKTELEADLLVRSSLKFRLILVSYLRSDCPDFRPYLPFSPISLFISPKQRRRRRLN